LEAMQRNDTDAIPRHLKTNTQRDVGLDIALRADGYNVDTHLYSACLLSAKLIHRLYLLRILTEQLQTPQELADEDLEIYRFGFQGGSGYRLRVELHSIVNSACGCSCLSGRNLAADFRESYLRILESLALVKAVHFTQQLKKCHRRREEWEGYEIR